MGRVDAGLLERVVSFCERAVILAEHLDKQSRLRRVVDQLMGSGTAVGANLFEADEALSRKDFCKCVAISIKELNETRFWLMLVVRREWITADRVTPLSNEADELKRILGAILSRSRQRQTL